LRALQALTLFSIACATIASQLLCAARCGFSPFARQSKRIQQEEPMIFKMVRVASLTLVLVLGFGAWAQPSHRAAACSNSTLNGNSGFVVTGTNASGPTTTTGQITADGKGSLTGVETESSNGKVVQNIPIKGTYKVRANCTGSGAVTPKGASTSHFDFVVVSAGTGLEFVLTDSGTTESGSAQAQGAATCTTKGLQGTYGLQANGALVGTGAIALNGQVKFHQGVISGTMSGSINGQTFTGGKVGGAYKAGSNCLGGAVVSVNQQSSLHLNLVVVNGGKEILFIDTDSGFVVSGSLQQ
jgi:hypothetical protein